MRGDKFPDCLSQFELSLLLGEAQSIPVKMWFYGWCCPGLEEGKGLCGSMNAFKKTRERSFGELVYTKMSY